MLASRAYKIVMVSLVVLIVAVIAVTSAENRSKAAAAGTAATTTAAQGGQGCPTDNAGLKLPTGFCATVFAEGIGHARHLVVAPDGVVYVNTWSGRYFPPNETVHEGGFLVALQDKTGSGKADVIERFGETKQTGGAGGTGIALYN